jgi:hypothetical protein
MAASAPPIFGGSDDDPNNSLPAVSVTVTQQDIKFLDRILRNSTDREYFLALAIPPLTLSQLETDQIIDELNRGNIAIDSHRGPRGRNEHQTLATRVFLPLKTLDALITFLSDFSTKLGIIGRGAPFFGMDRPFQPVIRSFENLSWNGHRETKLSLDYVAASRILEVLRYSRLMHQIKLPISRRTQPPPGFVDDTVENGVTVEITRHAASLLDRVLRDPRGEYFGLLPMPPLAFSPNLHDNLLEKFANAKARLSKKTEFIRRWKHRHRHQLDPAWERRNVQMHNPDSVTIVLPPETVAVMVNFFKNLYLHLQTIGLLPPFSDDPQPFQPPSLNSMSVPTWHGFSGRLLERDNAIARHFWRQLHVALTTYNNDQRDVETNVAERSAEVSDGDNESLATVGDWVMDDQSEMDEHDE